MPEFNSLHGTSDKQNLMVLIGLATGFSNTNVMSNTALRGGIFGFLISYFLAYILVGVPLFYMEMIVGQFTAKDCIKVWKIRSCLSHMGYALVLWQIFLLIQQHMMASFTNYYLLLSFEEPIPFHTCGDWSDNTCNIMNYNYTVHHKCVRSSVQNDICKHIYTTFPEYQFWRYKMLHLLSNDHIEYRVCISSFILCAVMYICCFKRMASFKIFLPFMTIYPLIGNVLLLIGSMTQEGSVKRYNEIMDTNFEIFVSRNRISLAILHVVQALKVGTGLVFNWSSTFSFRSPCYSLTLISIVFSILCTLLSLCTTALMICPFAYQANTFSKIIFIESPMSLFYEKTPLALKLYLYEHFWLFVFYSSNCIIGLRSNIIIYFSLLELIFTRFQILAKYSECICMIGVVVLFIITIPLFGAFGIALSSGGHKVTANLSTMIVCSLECATFLLFYGLDRISQDVHFMIGIKPKLCIKILWIISLIALLFGIFEEILREGFGTFFKEINLGTLMLTIIFVGTIAVLLLRLIVAWVRGRLREATRMDSTWGPDSEVLQRSRAMFSAQAMTKEYMYRQYQLRARILNRQKMSNIIEYKNNL